MLILIAVVLGWVGTYMIIIIGSSLVVMVVWSGGVGGHFQGGQMTVLTKIKVAARSFKVKKE